jgi:quercetin dioxygenase-like cupin family protein/catechol-2,3-dioxygenase
MIQQTIDPQINPSDKTMSEDMQRAGNTDQPDHFFLKEAAWNPPKEASRGCCNTGMHHVGLHVANPAASAEFYRDVLGMEIVGGSAPDHPIGATAFLSSRPDEESHEIALFANPAFAHVAFKVSSLAELRSFYSRVVERNIPIKFLANHGVSFAFYFDDPDGNMIEVYWPTGELSRSLQPQMEPLDLSQPDKALLEKIAAAKHAQAGAPTASANGTASQRRQFKYVPAGTGPAYWGPGDQITFLITGAETGGAFFMAEVSVPPAGGPPPHVHYREEESFHVLQGTLTIQAGGKTVTASPGDFVHLPRGMTHSFQNTGSVDAKFLVVVTPAGLEKFFEEAFYPATDRSSAPPLATEALLARLLAAAPRYGLELPSAGIAGGRGLRLPAN